MGDLLVCEEDYNNQTIQEFLEESLQDQPVKVIVTDRRKGYEKHNRRSRSNTTSMLLPHNAKPHDTTNQIHKQKKQTNPNTRRKNQRK